MHDDLPLLFAWLRTPEVVRWWGEPEHEAELLREDIDNPLMVMRIVSYRLERIAETDTGPVAVMLYDAASSTPAGSSATDGGISPKA